MWKKEEKEEEKKILTISETWWFYIYLVSGGAKGGDGGGRPRRHIYRGGNFARKFISTTPIGAPIYIWPRAAIPPCSATVFGYIR